MACHLGTPTDQIDFRQMNCPEISAAILPAADNEKKGTCFFAGTLFFYLSLLKSSFTFAKKPFFSL